MKLKYKEFEFEFEENIKLDKINQFLNNTKGVRLIHIDENVYFNLDKKLITRINVYFVIEKGFFKKYNIFKLNISDEKRVIDKNIIKITKFLKTNDLNYKSDVLGISTNHYLHKKVLMVRNSIFINLKNEKE